MKKKPLFFLAFAALALGACAAEPSSDASSATSGSSSTSEKTVNTLSSVLQKMGVNLRENVVFNFLGAQSVPGVYMDYVEKGVSFQYRKFPDAFVDGGFLDDADGHAYKWTKTQVDHWNESKGKVEKKDLAVKEGPALTNSASEEVSTFRDAFYTPSYIQDHVDDFLAENVFIPRIAGTTYGTFDLFGKVYESELGGKTSVEEGEETGESSEEEITSEEASGALIQDNTAILETLAKCMGVYDTAQSFVGTLELDRADLYFAEKGTSFTFTFYFVYDGGYKGLQARAVVSKIGENSVEALDNYFDPDFEPYDSSSSSEP